MRVIDETQRDVARLMDADRDFKTARSGDLHNDFYAWVHHLARRVPRLPRRVFVSDEVQLYRARYPAIDRIQDAFQLGQDVGPWLSKQTRLRVADHRADLMFNDWQILHFHLGNIFRSPTLIKRSGQILYAHVSAEEVTFLDVQPHQQWARLDLLKILLRTNPKAMDRYEARGCTGQRLADEQYLNLRLNGYNTLIEIDGRAFMLGMGRMSSQHALRLILYADSFWEMVANTRMNIEADEVDEPLKRLIYSRIEVSVRLGAYYDPTGLAIVDKNRNALQLHKVKPIE